jgi:hypothetical protein
VAIAHAIEQPWAWILSGDERLKQPRFPHMRPRGGRPQARRSSRGTSKPPPLPWEDSDLQRFDQRSAA